MTAVAAVATRRAVAAVTPVADQACITAVAAVVTIAAVAEQPAVAADTDSRAGLCRPGVAVAEQHPGVRLVGVAITDEDPDEITDPVGSRRNGGRDRRRSLRCAGSVGAQSAWWI